MAERSGGSGLKFYSTGVVVWSCLKMSTGLPSPVGISKSTMFI